MSSSNRTRIGILVEAAAIMLSILLAFGIEAWWQERGERLEEREILRGLATEFSAYQERLTRDASRAQAAERLLAEILSRGPAGARALPVAAVDSAIFLCMQPPNTFLH